MFFTWSNWSFTLVLTIATCALAIFGWLQLSKISSQIQLAKDAFTQQTKTDSRSLRAYVVTDSRQPFPRFQDGRTRDQVRVEPVVTIRNTGMTPAYKLGLWGHNFAVNCPGYRQETDYLRAEMLSDGGGPRWFDIYLAPNDEKHIPFTNTNRNRREFSKAFKKDGKCLAVIGRLEFEDEFGKSHALDFVHIYQNWSDPARVEHYGDGRQN